MSVRKYTTHKGAAGSAMAQTRIRHDGSVHVLASVPAGRNRYIHLELGPTVVRNLIDVLKYALVDVDDAHAVSNNMAPMSAAERAETEGVDHDR